MTDYTKLADAAMTVIHGKSRDTEWFRIGNDSKDAEAFIKDGRTVLALMAAAGHGDWMMELHTGHWAASCGETGSGNESLPIAIAEAALRALGEID